MRMTTMATIVSSVLLGSAAYAGDTKITQEQFTAADTDRDGAITLAEAQAGMPTLAAKFSSVDANADGKVSADEMTAFHKAGDKSMEADESTTPPTDK